MHTHSTEKTVRSRQEKAVRPWSHHAACVPQPVEQQLQQQGDCHGCMCSSVQPASSSCVAEHQLPEGDPVQLACSGQ
jgi:hypothetical protein